MTLVMSSYSQGMKIREIGSIMPKSVDRAKSLSSNTSEIGRRRLKYPLDFWSYRV